MLLLHFNCICARPGSSCPGSFGLYFGLPVLSDGIRHDPWGITTKEAALAKSRDRDEMTVEAAREMLHSVGLRATACRLAVLRHLAVAGHPVTHSDVAIKLAAEGFDNSTIYRALVEFADAGIAARLDLGDHVWRFELLTGEETDLEHPHFVCVDCGKVACATDVQVTVKRRPGRKAPVGDVTQVLLKGHCPECR